MIVLAGDVGGTNARLALVELDAGRARVQRIEVYPSREFAGLTPIVREFLKATGARPERACYGLAGPVVDQRCHLSSLTWSVVDAAEVARDTGIAQTWLINDFSAVAYGIARLGPRDLITLQEGTPIPGGPIGLIGAGTGLGHGFLMMDKGSYGVHPSEAGHTTFAARNRMEWELAEWLIHQYGRASWERVVSGPGFVNIYNFLVASGYAPEQRSVRDEMREQDPAAVVTKHGMAGTDRNCVKAVEMFVAAYGAQAGHLAIAVVATGGIYVAGGIAPRLIGKLQDGCFMESFRALGRFTEFASKVPVKVIMNQDVGLLGAAAAAFGWSA